MMLRQKTANAGDTWYSIAHLPNAIIVTTPQPRDDMVLLLVGSRHFADENDTPNGASLCKGNRPTKRGRKRKVSLTRLRQGGTASTANAMASNYLTDMQNHTSNAVAV